MEQFSNNASSTLGADITNVATSLTVASASTFPTTGNFRILIDSEIILVTAVSGTTFTISRAQEGTVGAAHITGTNITHILTAGGLGQYITDHSSGSLILLEQHTASNSAELDFTSWYSSSYDEYLIEIINLLPATNAVTVRLQYSTNGGTSYDSGSNYIDNAIVASLAGTNRSSHNTTTSHPINLYDNDAPVSNDTNYSGLDATFRLINPAGAIYKHMYGQAHYWGSTTNLLDAYGGLVYKSTTAINAFKIFSSSGNLLSGTVRIYGIAK